MAVANSNFDQLVATSLKNYRHKLHDNVTEHQVILAQLKKRGFVEEKDGGTSIVEPLMHEYNSTVKSYSGFDILDNTPQTGISAAEYLWKQVAGTVQISGEEIFKNSGSATQIVSLIDSKIRQLDLSMRSAVSTMLFGDGTGNGGKDITGLGIQVENGADGWSTVGGINSSTFTFWRNKFLDATGNDFTDALGNTIYGVAKIRNIVNSAARQGTSPTLIVTTQNIFELYAGHVGDKRRFVTGELADMGFKAYEFDGIPMVWDQDVSAGNVFVLNAEFLRWVIGKGRNFVTSDFIRPINQDAKTSQTLLYSNLVTSNRARQGRIIGLGEA
jgi:hypothetical protein